MAGPTGFWRGPIEERAQALRITKAAAWSFGAAAVLLLVPMLLDLVKADHATVVGDFAIIMLLALPSAVLLVQHSRGAAATLLICSAVFLLASLAFVAMGVMQSGAGALLGLPLSLAWVVLGYLAWRAVKAAFALHRMDAAA
jgi:hypothetical protein